MPPGVLVSSRVGGNGALIEVESLLGRFADCARRWRILSTEPEPRAAGNVLVNVRESAWVSVTGVGGVTSVVGGSWRLCGVEGIAVLSDKCFGVAGSTPCLLPDLLLLPPPMSSLGGRDGGVSCSLEFCVFMLFLLLEVLNIPPNPLPPPPSVLAGSVSPPDFLRGSVQALRSLPLGDELRSGIEAKELLLVLLGSTM